MNILPGVVQNKHRARAHSFRQTHGPTFLMRMENSRNKYSVYNSSICVAVLHRARVPFVAICELVCVYVCVCVLGWNMSCHDVTFRHACEHSAPIHTPMCDVALWELGVFLSASPARCTLSGLFQSLFRSAPAATPNPGITRIRMDVSRAHDRRVQTIGMVQLKMPLLRFQKPSRTADRIERRQRSV